MTTHSTLGPKVAPRSVPRPDVAPRLVPGPNVAPRSAPGVASRSTLGPITTNINNVAGPSTLGSGFQIATEYWVVTNGERPGVYFGQYVFKSLM